MESTTTCVEDLAKHAHHRADEIVRKIKERPAFAECREDQQIIELADITKLLAEAISKLAARGYL